MTDLNRAQTNSSLAQQILLIAGIILIASNLRPGITAVGPLIDMIRMDMDLSNAVVGALTTMPLVGFGIFSFLIPDLANRFGIERTLFAGLLILLSGILLRLVDSVAVLLTGSAFVGLGIAVGNVLLPGLIKHKFPKKIGLMTSIYSTNMVVFASLASGLSVPLSEGAGLGWKAALAVWGCITVIAVLVWTPQLRNQPIKSTISSSERLKDAKELWSSPLAWQVTLFMGLQSFAFYVSVTWLPEILRDKGISISTAGWLLSMTIFIGIPATFLAPILAERLKDQRSMMVVLGILYMIGYGVLLMDANIITITISVLGIGITLGAYISLGLALFGMRANNARQAAALSGMAQSVGYLLAAAGPVSIGMLFDLTHSWTLPLITLLLVGVVMTLVGVGAGRNRTI